MEAMTKAGVLKSSNGLQPTSAATTVRVANGKTQVLDGPYADSKEQLGGFHIIDVRRSRCRDRVGSPLADRASRRRRGASAQGQLRRSADSEPDRYPAGRESDGRSSPRQERTGCMRK